MQKHTGYLWVQNSAQQSGLADWYPATEVDARIAELVKRVFEAESAMLLRHDGAVAKYIEQYPEPIARPVS